MANYKGMYTKLFNTISDTIEMLKVVQIETEEMFLEQDESNVTMLENPEE